MPSDAELLYNIAAGLGLIAYLLTNVLWLRVILVLGAGFYMATGFLLDLTSMIGWHIAYAAVNLVHVLLLIMDRSVKSLPPALRDLYHSRFIGLKPREFQRLLKINEEVRSGPARLLTEGDRNDRLILITDGEILIRKAGRDIERRGPGEFIGEMSVLTGEPASADVVIPESASYCYWRLGDLQRLQMKNLNLYSRFMMIVGQNVVEKLRHLTNRRFASDSEMAK